MGLYLRGRTWWLDATVAGKRFRISTGETGRKAAQCRANAILAELFGRDERPVFGLPASEPTLLQIWERYRPIAELRPSFRSIEYCMRRLFGQEPFARRRHLPPYLTPSSLKQQHVEALIQARMVEGLKPGSVNIEIANLSAMLSWARDTLGIPKPALRYRRIKSKEPMRRLTQEEVLTFIRHLDPQDKGLPEHIAQKRQDIHDMVWLAVLLGLRYSEICTLHWTNVDRLNWATVGIWRQKTSTEARLALPGKAIEIFKRRDNEPRSRHWVFPSWTDPSRPRAYSTKGFRTAVEELGLNEPNIVRLRGRLTFHALRRTFASILAEEGVGLYDIQAVLGHATPVMTQRYARLGTSRASKRVAAAISKVFG